MLMYPSKDDLLKNVNSDYSLVILAAKRSHEIRAHQQAEKNNQEAQGVKPMLDSYESVSPIGMALEEIASGDVVVAPQFEDSKADEEKED